MTGLPEVGALVEVTATGTVQRHGVDGTGFMITVEGGRAWIPACATVKVLAAPRPPEVLLLDCGHVVNQGSARVSIWTGVVPALPPRRAAGSSRQRYMVTLENAAVAAAKEQASTWRDWRYGDVPCTYSGGCSEPLRSHVHVSLGPGWPFVTVYDRP